MTAREDLLKILASRSFLHLLHKGNEELGQAAVEGIYKVNDADSTARPPHVTPAPVPASSSSCDIFLVGSSPNFSDGSCCRGGTGMGCSHPQRLACDDECYRRKRALQRFLEQRELTVGGIGTQTVRASVQ